MAAAHATIPPAVSTSGSGASGESSRPLARRMNRSVATASSSTVDATSAGATARRHSPFPAARHVPSVATTAKPRCYVAAAVVSAALASARALSVRSQVNSGSLRPKWPPAAVLR